MGVEKDTRTYVPGELILGFKSGTSSTALFDLSNSYGHRVESIRSLSFTSDLPPDSLGYVLDVLKSKSYTTDGVSTYSSGYLHYQTQVITLSVKLFGMQNRAYQEDWLRTVEVLKLKENLSVNGGVALTYVPPGTEARWKETLERHSAVEWVELNYYSDHVLSTKF